MDAALNGQTNCLCLLLKSGADKEANADVRDIYSLSQYIDNSLQCDVQNPFASTSCLSSIILEGV
jgi:hypothetical protein